MMLWALAKGPNHQAFGSIRDSCRGLAELGKDIIVLVKGNNSEILRWSLELKWNAKTVSMPVFSLAFLVEEDFSATIYVLIITGKP